MQPLHKILCPHYPNQLSKRCKIQNLKPELMPQGNPKYWSQRKLIHEAKQTNPLATNRPQQTIRSPANWQKKNLYRKTQPLHPSSSSPFTNPTATQQIRSVDSVSSTCSPSPQLHHCFTIGSLMELLRFLAAQLVILSHSVDSSSWSLSARDARNLQKFGFGNLGIWELGIFEWMRVGFFFFLTLVVFLFCVNRV